MQSTICSTCGQPLPAGAAFCGNCGAAQKPAGQPLSESVATIRAGAPPSGAEYAPTQLQPPPAPAQGSPSGPDAYASQYTPSPAAPAPSYQYAGPSGPNTMYASGPQGQVAPPPPMYAPGPPPVAAPGGGVQPWAQPPKKRSGAKVALGCLVALVLVVALLGGGGFLLVKALSKGGSTSHQGSGTPGTGTTTGAGNTPGSGSTPGGSGSGTQTLNNINRQAIYAGVNITIVSAQEAASLPDRQETDPSLYALGVQIKVSNQTSHGVYPTFTAIGSDGSTYELYKSTPASLSISWGANSVLSGALNFDVPKGSKIGDFTIQLGKAEEAPVTVPLSGSYDPTQWQQTTHQVGQTVTYDDGKIKGTVTQVVVGLWTPGYQAPKGMRLLLMYLHAVNNTAIGINVGDGTPPQYLLVYPNGDRSQPSTLYGTFIDAVVNGGESKDVGYDTFLIPTAPAPYVIVFLNPDGSTAGQVNLGTI